MKRFVLLASLLVCGSAVAAPVKKTVKAAPTRALQNFTFKEAIAGGTMDPNLVGHCVPSEDGIPGKLSCGGNDGKVAGIDLLLPPSYDFYNNRLTSLLFLYDNNGVDFLTLLSAFREKYGTPCKQTSEKWQNKAGSTFDNSTVTWCFKTGKLKLEQIGPSLKYGVVSYYDDVKAPSKETPKDF